MTDAFDPATRKALDAFTPPPLSAGFADRLMAGIEAAPAPLPPVVPRRPIRRGWRRGGIIAAGIAGFSLMSAAAAATGIFGEAARQTVRSAPVLGPIIAQVAPEKPKPARAAKAVVKASPKVTPPPVVVATPVVAEPVVPELTDEQARQAEIAARMAARMERRAARRAARGLPPHPRSGAIRQRLKELPPEEREAVIARFRERRAARNETREQTGVFPATQTPEGRALRRERFQQRRAARRAWREQQQRETPEVDVPE